MNVDQKSKATEISMAKHILLYFCIFYKEVCARRRIVKNRWWTFRKSQKRLRVGGALLSGVAALGTIIGASVELLGRFGPTGATSALKGWKPSDIGKKTYDCLASFGQKKTE